MTKTCIKCGESKPVERFHKCSSFKDGRYSTCATCRQASRRRSSPEALRLQRNRELRAQGRKLCPDCGEAKVFGEFSANRAHHDGMASQCKPCERARNDQFYDDHPGYRTERTKAWRVANPESARDAGRMDVAKRKARWREAFVEHVDPLVVLELADGACGICGDDVDPFAFEVDHIVPLSKGGFHNVANTQPAHPLCNRRKHATVPEEN